MDIHGADSDKVSWTKLSDTIIPKEKLYQSDVEGQLADRKGLIIYEFDQNGALLDTQVGIKLLEHVDPALNKLKDDSGNFFL